jgi:hypothetical protein
LCEGGEIAALLIIVFDFAFARRLTASPADRAEVDPI